MGRRKRRKFGCLIFVILFIIVIAFTVSNYKEGNKSQETNLYYSTAEVDGIIDKFAKKNNLSKNAWPKEMIELLKKNPEAKDYVLNYPFKKNKCFKMDLSEYKNCNKVPLFLQWDERWGYEKYASNFMGISGCGPTCLSMVSIYLLNDEMYTPKYVAEFAERNGYSVDGSGSAWSLISEGGEKLGLDVTEIPLDEKRIINNLEVSNPIICIMGPGDFTTTGHFIVITEYIDGKLKINDPNSKVRSEKLWDFDEIKYQIRNLWVCR